MTRLILVNRFFHPDVSATAQLASDLAVHLSARYDVTALTSRQVIEDPQARLSASGTLGNVRIHRLWSTTFGRGGFVGRALDYLSFLGSVGMWLLIHARSGDVVLAKTDPPALGVVTTLTTLGRRVRRVQWLQDLYPEIAVALGAASADGWLTRATRSLRDWSLRHSDLAVAVSEGMQAHVRGAARIVHIPNWSDDFDSAEVSRPGNELAVGYSGNLGLAHPIDALLQLADGPPEPGVRFTISGGGAHYDRLREHVARGRGDWTFLPYQPRERLAGLLKAPDLHLVILDPRAETYVFPSKVYGILSAGRPILHLGRSDGELAALLREHRCGWSIPVDSVDALRAKLRELRATPDALIAAGAKARQAYEQHFSRASSLAKWDLGLSALEPTERV